MTYLVPPVPPGVRDDADATTAYLLEDGFQEAPAGALRQKLAAGRPLRVKFGVDPTAPAVTWGWSVPLRRLRRCQELGHTAVLVIGDFNRAGRRPVGPREYPGTPEPRAGGRVRGRMHVEPA